MRTGVKMSDDIRAMILGIVVILVLFMYSLAGGFMLECIPPTTNTDGSDYIDHDHFNFYRSLDINDFHMGYYGESVECGLETEQSEFLMHYSVTAVNQIGNESSHWDITDEDVKTRPLSVYKTDETLFSSGDFTFDHPTLIFTPLLHIVDGTLTVSEGKVTIK
jgi:hypothetical protein